MSNGGGLSQKQVKWIVVGLLVTLVAIVAFQNWEQISVKVLFFDVRVAKFLLIVSVFFVGLLVGWLLRKRRKG